MYLFALILAYLCAGALSSPPLYKLEEAEHYFEQFIQDHGRQYASKQEKQERFEIFKQSLQRINEQNLQKTHAVFGITKFADVTEKEFLTQYTGYKQESDDYIPCKNITDVKIVDDPPESFDWRDHNAVTRARDQGHCGSCWAFATIGNVEGQHAIKSKELVEFSEQQLVDCDRFSCGCFFGRMITASALLMHVGGAMPEKDYPYNGKDDSDFCHMDTSKFRVKIADCIQYYNPTEDNLMKLLHTKGPVTVAIDATSIKPYHGGIVENCTFNFPNHGVLLVGYGKEKGIPYWILKNSWGVKHGEKGYFRIKRGVNACGIVTSEITSVVLK